VSLFGYLWETPKKNKNKKTIQTAKNFNNSDLGAFDFILDKIIDKSSITAGGVEGAIAQPQGDCV